MTILYQTEDEKKTRQFTFCSDSNKNSTEITVVEYFMGLQNFEYDMNLRFCDITLA